MENQPNTLGSLFENAGDYLETRVDLFKLQAVSKTSDAASSLVSGLIILLIICFAVIIFNIGLAIWVGELLGKIYLGFFVIAGFYALVALILHLFRNSWIKEPVSNMIIKKMLN
jgi:Putative Actinobacterial Holin-X, holin superfamily III